MFGSLLPPRGDSDLFSLPGVGPKTRRKWGRWPTSPAHRAWAGLPQVHLSPGRALASTACRDLEGRRRPPAAWPEAEVRQRTRTRHSRPDGHRLRQRLTHPSRPFAPQPQGRAAPSPLHPAGGRAPGHAGQVQGTGRGLQGWLLRDRPLHHHPQRSSHVALLRKP